MTSRLLPQPPSTSHFVRTDMRVNVGAFAELSFPGLLRNPHIGLPPSGVNGRVAMVEGLYEYYHYMQRTGHGTEGSAKVRDLPR